MANFEYENHVSFTYVLEAIRKAGYGASHVKVFDIFKTDPKSGPALVCIRQGEKRTLLLTPKDIADDFIARWIETHRIKPKEKLDPVPLAVQTELDFKHSVEDRLSSLESKIDRLISIWDKP